MNPWCSTFSFQIWKLDRQSTIFFPWAFTISVDPLLISAHPSSLLSKVRIVMTSCIMASFSMVRPSCTLEYHMLSKRAQKNQIINRSCQQLLNFSSVMAVLIFLMRSFGLPFPTYIISMGSSISNATFLITDVNFLIHSKSSPPYKQMYFPSLIY